MRLARQGTRATGLAIGLLALALGGMRGCEGPRIALLEAPGSGRTWERFESSAEIDYGGGNPFDPAVVDARGQFVAPDGAVREIPAFATREFDRELVGGFEKIVAPSALHWRVRFVPDRPGAWRWRWTVTTPAGTRSTAWRALTVAPPAPDRHGVLRVSPLDPRYLRFDDGTPFFAVGENLGWYDGRGTFAYDDWLAKLAAQGVNTVRLWMPSWAFGIEWETLGDYAGRLDRAWQLDRVLETADAYGIQVMLCVQNHGPFSLDANSQWADNPYNAANGGPLAEPREFFTDPAARALFRRRLRYVVARWGASTNLLAWELWNEVNLAQRPGGSAVVDWHREMARELRDLDPWDHLVTTSVSLGDETTPIWQLPEIDFTQSHTYNWPFLLDQATLLHTFNLRTRVPGKPSLVGEMGSDFRGPAETLATDPSMIGFHDGLWVGVVGGTFGTGMTWWWDNLVDPLDLYHQLGAVAAFVRDIAFDEQGFVEARPAATAPGRTLDAWALVGDTVTLVWVKNAANHFAPIGNPGDATPVQDARLALDGLADGVWIAHWIDAYEGNPVAEAEVTVSDGRALLDVPVFARDVALRLERD